jgi:hypothetical protein
MILFLGSIRPKVLTGLGFGKFWTEILAALTSCFGLVCQNITIGIELTVIPIKTSMLSLTIGGIDFNKY